MAYAVRCPTLHVIADPIAIEVLLREPIGQEAELRGVVEEIIVELNFVVEPAGLPHQGLCTCGEPRGHARNGLWPHRVQIAALDAASCVVFLLLLAIDGIICQEGLQHLRHLLGMAGARAGAKGRIQAPQGPWRHAARLSTRGDASQELFRRAQSEVLLRLRRSLSEKACCHARRSFPALRRRRGATYVGRQRFERHLRLAGHDSLQAEEGAIDGVCIHVH
mmetsp:Transcript_57713/g.160845  ORF Transcript_57713/g.160845 Transcript_57713/m.160845 type:complete len:221 (-) Transcript_57713:1475-2137(-)